MEDIVEKITERTKGMCEMCYSRGEQFHHSISGRGKRKESETEYSVYLLCKRCHDLVHQDRLKDLKLKFETQNRYARQGYTEDEIRALLGGRIYTSDDIKSVFRKRNQDIDYHQINSIMQGLK